MQVRVEVRLDGYRARVKKQDGLVKGPERTALSSTHCCPAVLTLVVQVRCHLMIQSHAFACALSVSVRLRLDWLSESAELRLQRHLKGWHWSFGWQEKLV